MYVGQPPLPAFEFQVSRHVQVVVVVVNVLVLVVQVPVSVVQVCVAVLEASVACEESESEHGGSGFHCSGGGVNGVAIVGWEMSL
jgi:hypothetical protein